MTLTPGDGQDLLARFKSAREVRDPDAMMELFADSCVYHPDPFEGPLDGEIAIRAHWNDVAAEQLRVDFDAERVWVSGRTVLASWHAAFTRVASAERVRVRGFSTLELDADGLIARMRDWPTSRIVGIDSGHQPSGASGQTGE